MDRRAGVSPAPTRAAQFLVSPGSSNPAGCKDRHRTAPLARCGNRLADPVRTRGRIHRAEILPDPGRRPRKLPQAGQVTNPIGTLLPDRRNLHQRRPVSGPAERRLASISPVTKAFVAGGPRIAGRLPNPALFQRRRDTQVAYGVLAGAVARSCVASLLLTSCAAVNMNPRASRPPCRPGIAAAQGGNG